MEHSISDSTADLTSEEKRRQLYDRQVDLLNKFLECGAISKAQYDKSYRDLTAKMGFAEDD